jgi:hypothetical protein
VDAAAPVGATYAVQGVRAGSSLTFEREFGTAHVWKSVATFKLGASTATVNLPGDPVGAYVYKLRVSTGNRIDFYSATRRLFSYGSVTLSTLCPGNTNGGCNSGSVQLQNSTIYSYENVANTYSKASPGSLVMSFPNTSCRSGSLTIETGWTNGLDPNDSSYVQITQSASDPQITSLPDTSQTVFKFNLDGGPFDVDNWHSGGTNAEVVIYYSGTFNCYTLNGLR